MAISKPAIYFALVIFILFSIPVLAQTKDTRCYELRVYYCYPGRLDALIERFTNHTTKLFEKHGMENIGYWVPVKNEQNALYYVLAYPTKQARDSSWKAFSQDTTWQGVQKRSEASGKIVAKVESTFMETTAFSPAIIASRKSPQRLFELRTYTCHPDKLPNLLARFKNHTCKLFEQAGMTNIAYWTTIPGAGEQAKLVYILAHPNEAAAQASWKSFRQNSEWISARDASEKNGAIVANVVSVMMQPLAFSAIK